MGKDHSARGGGGQQPRKPRIPSIAMESQPCQHEQGGGNERDARKCQRKTVEPDGEVGVGEGRQIRHIDVLAGRQAQKLDHGDDPGRAGRADGDPGVRRSARSSLNGRRRSQQRKHWGQGRSSRAGPPGSDKACVSSSRARRSAIVSGGRMIMSMKRPKIGSTRESPVAKTWNNTLFERSRAARKAQYDRLSQKASR